MLPVSQQQSSRISKQQLLQYSTSWRGQDALLRPVPIHPTEAPPSGLPVSRPAQCTVQYCAARLCAQCVGDYGVPWAARSVV